MCTVTTNEETNTVTTLLHNLRMLTRYSSWADEKLFDALARLPEGAATEKKGSAACCTPSTTT